MSQVIAILTESLKISHDRCVSWPLSKDKNGYGLARFYKDGKVKGMAVQRALLFLKEGTHPVDGIAPFKGAQAAHSCGNRGCINPNHVSWKTQRQNSVDKLLQGKHNTAMPDGHVIGIMIGLVRKEPRGVMCKRYKTSYAAIKQIEIGKTYRHIPRPYGLLRQ